MTIVKLTRDLAIFYPINRSTRSSLSLCRKNKFVKFLQSWWLDAFDFMDFINYNTITMNDDKEYLSQEKFDELKNELDELRSVKRKKVLADLEYAKSLGDLSENAEYHEARSKQAELEDRVALIESLLKSAVIVSHKNTDIVSMGSKVMVKKEGGNEMSLEIVGTEEADMAKGKLSNKSPIGQSLIGKKKGDKVTVKTPGGEAVYTVLDVK